MSKCAVLFSGGTDSLCTAALLADQYETIHLLTYYESATKQINRSTDNIEKLKFRYPKIKFIQKIYSIDRLLKKLSYDNYFKSLGRHHFYNLATPGLSSLSWHVSTILYCKEKNIDHVYDGMTQELLHLPGHMPEIRLMFVKLYAEYKITFSSLVIDWEVPEDLRFTDKLIVDRHGFGINQQQKKSTTGQWLFEKNFLPHPNIKGSEFDRLMQQDCYPFIVYNLLIFWFFDPLIGFKKTKLGIDKFMKDKILTAKVYIEEHVSNKKEILFDS